MSRFGVMLVTLAGRDPHSLPRVRVHTTASTRPPATRPRTRSRSHARQERALDAHTRPVTSADAKAAAARRRGRPQDVGEWGPVVDWPVVGVHVALLPNGKVLAYDSIGDNATETLSRAGPHARHGVGSGDGHADARQRRHRLTTSSAAGSRICSTAACSSPAATRTSSSTASSRPTSSTRRRTRGAWGRTWRPGAGTRP